MDKATIVFNKYAFLAVTPFDVKSKGDLNTVKGYAKEQGNRIVGSLAGAGIGAIGGGVLGAVGGANGSALGATVGSAVGAITSDVRSLRKTEREAGVKPTGLGKYLVRQLGATAVPIPFLGDYLVSRHFIDYETGPKLKTNG